MPTLNSTHLRSADYDDESETMLIEFHSGHKYEYDDVPRSVYESLINAVSPGAYFRTYIKNQYTGIPVS